MTRRAARVAVATAWCGALALLAVSIAWGRAYQRESPEVFLGVHEPVKGFGSACWAGLQAATSDIVCFMDCDASLDPVALPLLVGYVERDEAVLVIGERIARRGAWPPHARAANRVLAAEVRRRTRLPLADLGPMRVMRRETLLGLGMIDRRSGWPLEMVLRAAGAGLRLRTVPVEYRGRAGRSKVTGTVRGTVRAVLDMSRMLRTDATDDGPCT